MAGLSRFMAAFRLKPENRGERIFSAKNFSALPNLWLIPPKACRANKKLQY